MPSTRDTGTLLARVLLSLIFFGGGITQISDPGSALHQIRGRGLPLAAAFLAVSAAAQLLGSAAIVLGWRTRWGAALLLAFIIPATLLFHLRSDQTDLELFTRDLAIAGGLVLLIQQGPGALSVDARAAARTSPVGPPPPEAAPARS